MSAVSASLREEFTIALVQVSRRWRWRLDKRLESLGLTQARWAVLLQISRLGDAPSQKRLAEFVGIEGATLVHLLNGLEKQDLIERRPDPNDGRAKTVHLTGRARDLIAEIDARADRLRLELVDGLDDHALAACVDVFRHIDSRLTALAEAER